jgi:hypothetical protein
LVDTKLTDVARERGATSHPAWRPYLSRRQEARHVP